MPRALRRRASRGASADQGWFSGASVAFQDSRRDSTWVASSAYSSTRRCCSATPRNRAGARRNASGAREPRSSGAGSELRSSACQRIARPGKRSPPARVEIRALRLVHPRLLRVGRDVAGVALVGIGTRRDVACRDRQRGGSRRLVRSGIRTAPATMRRASRRQTTKRAALRPARRSSGACLSLCTCDAVYPSAEAERILAQHTRSARAMPPSAAAASLAQCEGHKRSTGGPSCAISFTRSCSGICLRSRAGVTR